MSMTRDFPVSGCADLVPGPGMRMTRDADQLIVGCDVSSSTWHLTCVDDRWTGVIGNCSQCTSSVHLVVMIVMWDSCLQFCWRWKCVHKNKSRQFKRDIVVCRFSVTSLDVAASVHEQNTLQVSSGEQLSTHDFVVFAYSFDTH